MSTCVYNHRKMWYKVSGKAVQVFSTSTCPIATSQTPSYASSLSTYIVSATFPCMHVYQFCRHFPSLHYLSLAYSLHFTTKGLHSITSGKGCRRLVYFDLSGCTQLLAEGLGFIGRGCQILSTLLLDDIPECNDSMILKLVAHCRTLRHISFMGGSKLSDRAFKYLAMENRRLRTIKIESTFIVVSYYLVTYCLHSNPVFVSQIILL